MLWIIIFPVNEYNEEHDYDAICYSNATDQRSEQVPKVSHHMDVIENPYYGENEDEITYKSVNEMNSLESKSEFSPVVVHKNVYYEWTSLISSNLMIW